MKNSSLIVLVLVLTGALSAVSFAEKPNKNEQAAKPEKQKEADKPAAKPAKTIVAWCGLYEHLRYLTGEYAGKSSSDKLERRGTATGAGCSYNNDSRLTLALGAEFYLGKLDFAYENFKSGLKGSASYLEVGEKEWASASFNLNDVRITANAGIEKTDGSRFELTNLEMDFGYGQTDITWLVKDHVSSTGELETKEAGLGVEFPFLRRFSFTFGALYKEMHVVVRVKVDKDIQDVLDALHYDVSKVNQDFDHVSKLFYLTPGVRLNLKDWDFAIDVPWGLFSVNKGSWGTSLRVERKF